MTKRVERLLEEVEEDVQLLRVVVDSPEVVLIEVKAEENDEPLFVKKESENHYTILVEFV